MGTNRIEWTERTWNPTIGCSQISPGCNNCYAEAMAKRLKGMGTKGYENGFRLTLLPDRLNEPLSRKKPTLYFVNSMSDLFHGKVPFSYIDQVINVIERSPQHTFQILTKRAKRMANYFSGKHVPENTWLGVTVENKSHGLPRLDELRKISASIRFLSIEPLLEDLGTVNLDGIDWVIVGGESGPKARLMQKEWVCNIREQCQLQSVAFFFKQWGGWGADGVRRNKKKNGRELDGQVWNQTPKISRQHEPIKTRMGGTW
ncbi:phage Gp37/Gp68 family protein [Desulfurivibrio alkaliphilus]|uniref:Gp37Gp68 family protein n=1 Tax=Desulfurivibrio alkaliphilus (strain DSM 19089 / UNIQEM U267 / AHT2) TaxID=589865 RepID=D6Z102_DESAT|nr:Gp37Gp68 family protein [Desulfurivibrio alkaliphilus AHT 2]